MRSSRRRNEIILYKLRNTSGIENGKIEKKYHDSVFYYYEDWTIAYWVIKGEYYMNTMRIETSKQNERMMKITKKVWVRKWYEEDWNIREMADL